jgi:hypothetical protein
MQCTGAAKLGVFKWKITRRGPVIAVVRPQKQHSHDQTLPQDKVRNALP